MTPHSCCRCHRNCDCGYSYVGCMACVTCNDAEAPASGLTQLHQGSAGCTADKPQGGGEGTPRLKNSPTVAELRSLLADATMEWAAVDGASRKYCLSRLETRITREAFENIMRDLAATIEVMK